MWVIVWCMSCILSGSLWKQLSTHYCSLWHFSMFFLEYASLSAICPLLELGCRLDPILCTNLNGLKIRLFKSTFHQLSSLEPIAKQLCSGRKGHRPLVVLKCMIWWMKSIKSIAWQIGCWRKQQLTPKACHNHRATHFYTSYFSLKTWSFLVPVQVLLWA